ncbi:unnamed protein product [Didymodactylos carnosus]|uniref:Protein kinase domain-containing protein n=1 Tax=Didymodactylos carnosus TaxID=1234261 RepID=A0A813PQW8_9BILA|nr:unnamed protein product [Didymodactylos carnosus]CAF1441916.1 unnamed protein product [Didymodactylos carnosus]CAF3534713.1 unnamed protein product [Didymodactylos carnosus]CAF4238037.1 unnamed protein product [Didymodactylos carnosus]
MPKLQSAEPSVIQRCLTSDDVGTYVIRQSCENDELVSSIEPSRNSISGMNNYIILSVRCEESNHKCLVTHYRIPVSGTNITSEYLNKLIEYYQKNPAQTKGIHWPHLKKELPISTSFVNVDGWRINIANFKLDNWIKGGNHNSYIQKGIWDKQQLPVFIKRYQRERKDLTHYFNNEFRRLRELCYFPIVQLYGYWSDDEYLYLILADGGRDLFSYCPLKNKTEKSVMRRVANVGFQIASGMMYLEKCHIVHRDLTAGNVLVDKYGFIRIADFGHSMKLEEGRNNLRKDTENFQFRWLAPECLPFTNTTQITTPRHDKDPIFTSKSDVWSLGITLIQLMIDNPKKPYPALKEDSEIVHHVKLDKEIHPKPINCSVDMYLLLQRCWAYETKDRITFQSLRERMFQLERINT